MPQGKHFINDVADPIERALRSLLIHDSSLRLIESEKVLYRQVLPNEQAKVLLLSGGGSGHEPAHAGFVGAGMLDIAVAGNIFASPSSSQVSAGLNAVDAPKGILIIVKNYTGDRLNFGLAAEKAKANGRQVDIVVVGDDVSIEGNSRVGRRGLAGTVLVHKVAGAAAARGWELDRVTKTAQEVADKLRTMGVSLDKCSVPGREAIESLPYDEVEFGMGIHNEPGARRAKLSTLHDTVQHTISTLLQPRPDVAVPQPAARLCVLINNLGGLSLLEQQVVVEEVLSQLGKRFSNIERVLVGAFVTSLDGPGFSITVLEIDDLTAGLLDDETQVSAWPRGGLIYDAEKTRARVIKASIENKQGETEKSEAGVKVKGAVLNTLLGSLEKQIRADEPKITKWDTIAGDGDCGETLVNGITALVKHLKYDSSKEVALSTHFQQTAHLIERSMGGTSGAIYAIFFNAMSANLVRSSASGSGTAGEVLADSLRHALSELQKYTTARKGDRTLMDALIPFIDALPKDVSGGLDDALRQAAAGAEATRSMGRGLGRSSYVDEELLKGQQGDDDQGVPDPGAMGVVSVLKGIQAGLRDAADC